jgi:hypothetical protein
MEIETRLPDDYIPKRLVSGLGKGKVLYKAMVSEKPAPESPVQKIKEMYGSVRWW